MTYIAVGLAVLVLTLVVFWYSLPRGGKTHRFVGTELEPYIGVAFAGAVALSCTLALSGAIDMIGTP